MMMLVACVDDTQVGQSPLLYDEITLETVTPKPDNAPINKPTIIEPDNAPTSEPIISEADNTPTNEPAVSEPNNDPTPIPNISISPIFNWTTIKTREEFHDMATIANGTSDIDSVYAYSNMDDKDFKRLIGHTFYYDFLNLIEDVVLHEIRVHHAYVDVEYQDKEGIDTARMMIKTIRGNDNEPVNEEQFIEGRRRSNPYAEEIIINGKRTLKDEVFWDNIIYNGHICNQYVWLQDAYSAVFLKIPKWLLDRYPEETFFDIYRVDIQ